MFPKKNCDILREYNKELNSNEVFQLLNKYFSKQCLNVNVRNTARDISVEQKLWCFIHNYNKLKLQCYRLIYPQNIYSGSNIHY